MNNLALNEFAFEPLLTGPVEFSLAEGGQVDLRGGGDRIVADLDADLTTGNFDVQLGDIIAQGEVVNRQLTADVQNFPIASLELAPGEAYGFGPLGGTLDAAVTGDLADLSNLSAQGTVEVADLALGNVVADTFIAEFSLRRGAGRADRGRF